MKWFLIQSFFLAVASFGLGALFHRLLWKRSKDAGSPPTGSVTRFSGDEEADHRRVNDGVLAARAAELAALQVGHEKVLADRDAKIKEFAALSFEHSAAKAALADRDESVGSLRSQLEAAALASSAASGETRDLRGQVASQRVLIEELRAQLVAANADNHAALATMRTDTDGRLADLSSEHDAALAQLRVDYDGRLAAQAATHEAAVAALRAEHERAWQDAHGDRDRTLSGLRSDHEKSLAELRRRTESAEDDLTRLTAEHDGCAADMARLRADLDAKHVEVQGLVSNLEATKLRVFGSGAVQSFADGVDPGSGDAFEAEDVQGDDLLRIEGIGPKINEILRSGGVRTFRRLAALPVDDVRSIVNEGGVSFIPSADSWASQAALLRDGDETGFQSLVDRLVAGRDDAR